MYCKYKDKNKNKGLNIVLWHFLLVVSCKIKGVAELKEANTAGGCFMLLWKEEMFTPSDVIAMQYLLQMTDCSDLEKRCVKYAETQNTWYYLKVPPGIILSIKLVLKQVFIDTLYNIFVICCLYCIAYHDKHFCFWCSLSSSFSQIWNA